MALNPLDLFSRPSPLDLQPPVAAARDLLPGPHFEMLLQGASAPRPAPVPPPRPAQRDETKSPQSRRTEPARGDDGGARPADSPSDVSDDPSAAGPDDASGAAEAPEAQTADRNDQHEENNDDESDKKMKADSTGLEGIFCVMPPQAKPVNLEQTIVAADGAGDEAVVDAPLMSVGADASVQHLRGEIAPLEGQGGIASGEAAALEEVAPDETLIAETGNVGDQVPIAPAGEEAKAADVDAAATAAKLKQVSVESTPEVAALPEAAAGEAGTKTDAEISDGDQVSQVSGEALSQENSEKSNEGSEQSQEPAGARDTANPAVAASEQNARQEKTAEPVAAVEPKDNSTSKSDAISTVTPTTSVVDATPRASSPLRFSAQALAAEGLGGSGPKANIEVDATRFLHRVTKAFEAAQERGGEVRLRLSPPELGSLRLDVRIQDGALVARLEAETAAAKTVLIENLPALRDRLAEQGIRIERFDVDLMQHQAGGPPDQPQDRSQADHNPFVRAGRPVAAPIPSETSIFAPPSPSGITAEGLNVII